jgi:putative PEP-CTERM system histidine kinase
MPSFGLISYGLAAAGFLLLALLLLTSWEGRAQGVRLIAACVTTSVWAAALAYGPVVSSPSLGLVFLVELLRYGSWFVVLTGLTKSAGVAARLSWLVHATWIGAVVLLFGSPLLIVSGLTDPDDPRLITATGLLLALLGLLLLEQIYRNSSESGRFALKFFVIGLGVMFAYDLFLYSQAQLLKTFDQATWDARGVVVTLMVPLLAISARRNPQWSLNVFVSRQVVFYTTSFMVVGGYLLLMAFGGYLIRIYGGTWSRVAQLVFFAGAAIVLLMLLASGNLRRRLRVFLAKHFYRNKYDYREEWLRFIETLSQADPEIDTRENAIRSIAQIIGSPAGVLYLRSVPLGTVPTGTVPNFGPVAAWPRGAVDLGKRPSIDAGGDFGRFLQRRQWVIDLFEYDQEPDEYDNVEIPAGLRSPKSNRLVVPLIHVDELIGFIVFQNPPPPFKPNYEDRDLLKTVGRHVAAHLAQHEADKQLAESRQFEAYHRLTAFVMHDLKNLAAQLSLLVSNAEKHKRNPEFIDDAIATIANSTERMQRLIEQLQRREVQGLRRRVSLADIARRAAERCQVRAPVPSCEVLDEDAVVEADPERLAMIVEHVIRNAQEATPGEGRVAISVAVDKGNPDASSGGGDTHPSTGGVTAKLRALSAALIVEDNGSGMTPDFIKERLFKPFDTTKGSKGMGIGAYQVREYVQSIGGRVEVESTPGEGTTFTLRLPLEIASSAESHGESSAAAVS